MEGGKSLTSGEKLARQIREATGSDLEREFCVKDTFMTAWVRLAYNSGTDTFHVFGNANGTFRPKDVHWFESELIYLKKKGE